MTVPPHRRGHLLQELGFTVARVGDELHGSAEVVEAMAVPGTDVLRASILLAWADTLTGLLTAEHLAPRVPVTLQLDVHLYAPPRPRAVRAVARRVKAGRAVTVASVDLADEAGRPLGSAAGMFMAAPDPTLVMPAGLRPLDVLAEPGGPLEVPFAERARCTRRSPGVAALVCGEDGLNASGTLNGGLLALAVEEAALSAESADPAPGRTLSALAVRYLRPVRVGPAVATATAHGPVAQVTVADEGRDDTLAVLATTRTFDEEARP